MFRGNPFIPLIASLSIIATTFFPFHQLYAEGPFEAYEQIFKGGVAGMVNCAEQSVRGFVAKMAPELAAMTLEIIAGFLTNVPVKTGGLERLQSKALEAVQEQNIKEKCLDSIATGAAQQMLSQMINDSVAWINRVTEGEPLFIQNLNTELQRLAVRSFRDYIRTSDVVSATCSSYRDDVLQAIDTELNRAYGQGGFFVEELDPLEPFEENECQLDAITGSPEKTQEFLNGGDFAGSGGFYAYNAVINQELNQFQIEFEAAMQLADELNQLEAEFIANNGYRPDVIGDEESECKEGEEWNAQAFGCFNTETGERVPVKVKTPGASVKNIAEQIVNSDFYRVTMVRELSDLYAVAGDRLISKIFGGAKGLLGLDPQGNADDRIDTRNDGSLFESYGQEGVLQSGSIFSGSNPGQALIDTLQDRLALEQKTLEQLNEVRSQTTSEITNSISSSINACPAFGNDPDLKFASQTFVDLPVRVATGDYLAQDVASKVEVGPQKVDWAGNDFEWKEGERYGLQTCGDDVYSGDNDRAKYKENPKYSYYVARFYKKKDTDSFFKGFKDLINIQGMPALNVFEAHEEPYQYSNLIGKPLAQVQDPYEPDEITIEETQIVNPSFNNPDGTGRDSGDASTKRDDNGEFEYRWVIHVCRNVDDKRAGRGSLERWVALEETIPAFRDPTPRTVTKVDWEGNPLDWKRIDPFEKENRYVFNFCDETNRGRESYHVGLWVRFAVDRAIQYKMIPGSENRWFRSQCNYSEYSNENDTAWQGAGRAIAEGACKLFTFGLGRCKPTDSSTFTLGMLAGGFGLGTSLVSGTLISNRKVDKLDHSRDQWGDAKEIGPAFIEKQTLTGETLETRIASSEELIKELEAMLERMYALAPGLKPEASRGSTQITVGELEAFQKEFNALRTSFAFSENSEPDMIRGLYNDYVQLQEELQQSIEENCSE